ncbi:hypothetical protein HK405_002550, partial [Cladochytrium tenue]
RALRSLDPSWAALSSSMRRAPRQASQRSCSRPVPVDSLPSKSTTTLLLTVSNSRWSRSVESRLLAGHRGRLRTLYGKT